MKVLSSLLRTIPPFITTAGMAGSAPRAARAAEWLQMEAAVMSSKGKTATEVAARLRELKEVVADWEEGVEIDLPEGDPWSWSRDDLASYIRRRRGEW